jgi:release factor glutamine methyltransferase
MGSSKTNAGDWLSAARRRLRGVENNALEAQLLLGSVLGLSRPGVVAHPEIILSADQLSALESRLRSRLRGQPLPYILGHWEFYGLDLLVTPAVLIPRPETELLVDLAFAWLQAHPGRWRAAEVGTGSGAVSAALCSRLP